MPHACVTCGKQFANRHSRWRHQKNYCRGSEISGLKQAIEELKSLISHQQDGHSVMTITNNVTTTVNNHVTVNQFLYEDKSHIPHEAIKELIKRRDLTASLRKLIKMIHFDHERPQNHNVYLHDADAEHGFCWSKKQWQKKNVQELAVLVMNGAAMLMQEHIDDPKYEREYTEKETERFDEFYGQEVYDDDTLRGTIDTLATLSNEVFKTSPLELN